MVILNSNKTDIQKLNSLECMKDSSTNIPSLLSVVEYGRGQFDIFVPGFDVTTLTSDDQYQF